MVDFKVAEFNEMFQYDGEKFDSFVERLKMVAEQCNFVGEIDNNIQSMIIRRCCDAELRKKLLEKSDDYFETHKKKIPLETVINVGRKHEAITFKCKLIEKNQTRYMASGEDAEINAISKTTSMRECMRCGNAYPHIGKCPAIGKTCKKCGKSNHFANMCKSKAKSQNVNLVKYENDYENESNVWSIWTKRAVNTVKNMFIPLITLFMCQTMVSFAVDTGAQVNIIDEKTFNKLKFKPKLYKYRTSLFSYNSSKPIETLGQ